MADRIVVMEKGSVASNGDHETVLKQSAIYRNLIHGVTQGKKALERKQSNS
jgi:ABC-type multidrug transport system fused ATPase/permease subunit